MFLLKNPINISSDICYNRESFFAELPAVFKLCVSLNCNADNYFSVRHTQDA